MINKINFLQAKKYSSVEGKNILNEKEFFKREKIVSEISRDFFISVQEILGLTNIDIKIVENCKNLDLESKLEIKNDFMKLYNENYTKESEKNFLSEIEDRLEKMLQEDSKIYLFYLSGEPILSSYFTTQENGDLYWGGLNGSSKVRVSQFGVRIAEKFLELEGNTRDIVATATYEIQGEKNSRINALLRVYANKFRLKKVPKSTGKTEASKYFNLFRLKNN